MSFLKWWIFNEWKIYKHNLILVKFNVLGSFTFRQSGVVPLSSETHAGEDVPIYATGPMSHLFVGTHEQNYIAHVLAYASCVGPYPGRCDSPSVTGSAPSGSVISFFLLFLSIILCTSWNPFFIFVLFKNAYFCCS